MRTTRPASERGRCAAARGLRNRRGFSILELEVALVVFGIAVSGLAPCTVMYVKQLKRLEERFHPQTTYVLIPATDPWARKLGAAAQVSTLDPGTLPASEVVPTNDVRIVAIEHALDSEEITARVSVQALP